VWLDYLEQEWDNLFAAAEWSDATGANPDALQRLLTALVFFSSCVSHLAPGRPLVRPGLPMTNALAAAGAGPVGRAQ